MNVDVYRNLKYRDRVVYSVRYLGKVIDRVESITLKNVRFKSATDKQGDQCKKSRQVCQWIKGEHVNLGMSPGPMQRIVCDPKVQPGFFIQDTLQRVTQADFVLVDRGGVHAFNPR
ncbi:MAG: hypothetical protein NXI32_04865 [bacterium]|nr:hypothetical protein [bacterium]